MPVKTTNGGKYISKNASGCRTRSDFNEIMATCMTKATSDKKITTTVV